MKEGCEGEGDGKEICLADEGESGECGREGREKSCGGVAGDVVEGGYLCVQGEFEGAERREGEEEGGKVGEVVVVIVGVRPANEDYLALEGSQVRVLR